jgi:recombination protein RecA
MFNEGISATGDLIDLAVDSKVCEKSGSWFSYGEIRLGQGRERAKEFLRDNPELFDEIRAKVLEIRAPKPSQAAARRGLSRCGCGGIGRRARFRS